MDGPQDDRAGGSRQRSPAGRHEPHVAAFGAGDLIGAEAVERTVGSRRALRLVGPQDGELEIGEQGGVRVREAHDDAVVPVGDGLGDGLDDAGVPGSHLG